jgi:hypothetical protein
MTMLKDMESPDQEHDQYMENLKCGIQASMQISPPASSSGYSCNIVPGKIFATL